jgi:hypothetical protein
LFVCLFVQRRSLLPFLPPQQFNFVVKCQVAEIIEKGVREHPELSVGSNTDNIDVRSVGNSAVLRETSLVEAFNLKAAVEYNMKNPSAGISEPNNTGLPAFSGQLRMQSNKTYCLRSNTTQEKTFKL